MPSVKTFPMLVAVIAVALVCDGATATAKGRPDLVVRSVSVPPASVQAGTGFASSAAVVNRGRARAPRSQLRFFLARGGKLALGTRGVRALRPRRRAGGRLVVTVPLTVTPGTYRLAACADATRRVRERSERNNCRTARGRVAVVAASRPGKAPTHPHHPGGPTPDPAAVAPPVDPTVASELGDTAAFLYEGKDPVQVGVAPGTIKAHRVAVIRGKVTDRDGHPVGGVAVTVLDHPELGHTQTRADGRYDIAVNGGGTVTLAFAKTGLLPAQRTLRTPWQDYAFADDVALVAVDPAVTAVETGAGAPVQVAQGSEITDGDGSRQATMIFDAGTTAQMELPDGSTRRLDDLHVRATEFTVGDSGPEAMPGALPPTSGFTYAAELSVDEALAAHATDVRFSKPVAFYVENFLGFPVGTAVPTGYYDREQAKWVASENGTVIKVVGEAGGQADVDTDGDGTADNDGIDAAERARLAGLYEPGQELWRVELTHFTPWDCNWPYGPPPDADEPIELYPLIPGDPPPDDKPDCAKKGSVIGCLERTLGEDVPVTGTSYRLRYSSARAPGRDAPRTVEIPLSGPSVPASLKRIRLELSVAGHRVIKEFDPAPSRRFTYVWDGTDAYGRKLQGEQPVTVRLGYVYNAFYYPQPADFYDAFARVSRTSAIEPIFGRDATEIVLWRDWEGSAGGWDAGAEDLGGWSLDAHHSYAPLSRTLYRGDGTRVRAHDFNKVVTNFAGLGYFAPGGDGGPATEAGLSNPTDLAVAPDGSVYIADRSADRVRKVSPDGTISTVAGRDTCTSAPCFSGDGGPATQAQLHSPSGLAVAPDGALYIADSGNRRVRRVSPAGVITTVAGDGQYCGQCADNGDGGPAAQARFDDPRALALAPDGALYIADAGPDRVRRIGPDGLITTVAGGGSSDADGVPATAGRIDFLAGMALAPDGSLYLSDYNNHKVRKVTPDGLIKTAVGTGRRCQGGGCFGGDGGPAIAADLYRPTGLAVGPDGTLYIADSANRRIRQVGADGIITTIAGDGTSCITNETTDECPHDVPGRQFRMAYSTAVAVAPDGSVCFIGRQRVHRITSALPGPTGRESLVASRDGTELYAFEGDGRHRETRDALTSAQLARFGYDGAGRLTTVTDRDGGVTRIERDAAGNPTAIVAPGGQRTTLAVDANGHLSRIQGPGGQAVTLTTGAGGLLTGLTEPGGAAHTFEYDEQGNLKRDIGPDGPQTLTRTELPGGWSVAHTDVAGRTTTYTVKRLPSGNVVRSVTQPGARTTETVSKPDGTTTTVTPAGDRVETVDGPDPRFGMQAPIAASVTHTTPGGKTITVTTHRTAELSDRSNVLSLTKQEDEVTAGARTWRSTYALATRKLTTVSAAGRTSVKTFDAKGRIVKLEPAQGVTPTTYSYTAQGRLHQVTQGTKAITYAYDARGRIAAKTDATGTATYAYDAGDRLRTSTLPGGRVYQYVYDADGRRTSVTLPSGAVHTFAYSATGAPTRFTPAGSDPFTFTLTAGSRLAGVTLPSGRTQTYARDAAGRLTAIAYAGSDATFTYDAAGRQTDLRWTRPGVLQQTALDYDGDHVTSAASTGAATGTFAYDYDDELRLTGVQLDAEPKITRAYDGDDLLTGLGPFTLTRDGAGRVTRIADAVRREDVTHDARGRIASRTFSVAGTDVYAVALTYDDADRITERQERRGGGAPKTTTYAYDAAGRLASVRVGGALTESYTYTADGDRLPGGGAGYQFDADGFLTRRGTTDFSYDAHGELVSAGPVTYAYDGRGRRVSRTQGGVTTEYLYGNPENALEVTATRGPGGLTRYFYDDGGHVFAFERGGERYLVATDQVGSATAIADASGAVVKAMTYDSFGVVTSDSNPAFPYAFGFAGGLADETTRLVHFGARDYDPASGRWTARDPGLDTSDGGNLYAYVGNDPVNRTDPLGLESVTVTTDDFDVSLDVTSKGISGCIEYGRDTEAPDGDLELQPVDIDDDLDLAPLTDPCGDESETNPDWSSLKPGSGRPVTICLRYSW